MLPLTFTRPVAALRTGIDTITEKWKAVATGNVSWLTEPYLAEKFPVQYGADNLYIYGGTIPDQDLLIMLETLQTGEALIQDNMLLALRSGERYFSGMSLTLDMQGLKKVNYTKTALIISRPWHLFQYNDRILREDFKRLTKGRKSQPVSPGNRVTGDQLFIEEGAVLHAAVINTTTGPVYIGKNAEVMEGSLIRGPFFLGENSVVKMGAKIYGPTTIGPDCKVGGEINNSVFTGFSNKAHDGFIGNSVIGEWCNLGADTNCSNLKNNYAEVKLWDYSQQRFISTGLQFCGLIMGDHSKCGINTMFNTGTVVGVNANIFGDGFPRNFIPSFSWGGASGFVTYKLSDAMQVAKEVMQRRNIGITLTDKKILTTIYELSEKYRKGQLIFLHK